MYITLKFFNNLLKKKRSMRSIHYLHIEFFKQRKNKGYARLHRPNLDMK